MQIIKKWFPSFFLAQKTVHISHDPHNKKWSYCLDFDINILRNEKQHLSNLAYLQKSVMTKNSNRSTTARTDYVMSDTVNWNTPLNTWYNNLIASILLMYIQLFSFLFFFFFVVVFFSCFVKIWVISVILSWTKLVLLVRQIFCGIPQNWQSFRSILENYLGFFWCVCVGGEGYISSIMHHSCCNSQHQDSYGSVTPN